LPKGEWQGSGDRESGLGTGEAGFEVKGGRMTNALFCYLW